MNILFLADWHSHQYNLPKNEVDLLIVLGDFDWRTISMLDKTFDCPKVGVLGNHDRSDTFRGTNFIHMHKQAYEWNGLIIAGFDGCPKYNVREVGQYKEDEVEEFTNYLDTVDIFIAHAGPMLTPTKDLNDSHRGFNAYTNYIQNKKPTYFAHGHNHVDKRTYLGSTEILSVYPYYLLEI